MERGLSKKNLARIIKKDKENNLKKFQAVIRQQEKVTEKVEECSRDSFFVMSEIHDDESITVDSADETKFREELGEWYIKYNVSRECCKALLALLKKNKMNVPKNPGTLVKTGKTIIRTCAPGHYWHYSIKKQMEKIHDVLIDYNEIVLDIGIDGLPLFKSSQTSLWPILGRIVNIENIDVFLIGAYVGPKKPYQSDNYLHDFVYELKNLFEFGYQLGQKTLNFKIRAFVCDAPAGAFVRSIVGHNSLHGCNKCNQVGKTIERVVTFSLTPGNSITDSDFAMRKYKNLHKINNSNQELSIESIGIGMVSQFPLDCMHLIDLGVVKKMLVHITTGKIHQPISKQQIIELSHRAKSLSFYIPKEFQRKPRGLDEISRWKATEFRQFILYTGIVILKNIVPEDVYFHFLILNCAYRILLAPKSYTSNLEPAEKMLQHFVNMFPNIYPPKSVTYNVHNLLHLTESVASTGFLNDFSAYSFENYMQKLKRNIKKPTQVLQQLANKLDKHSLKTELNKTGTKKDRFGRIISYSTKFFFLNNQEPDCFCCIYPDIYIKITGFTNNAVIGKKLSIVGDFFDAPLKSNTDLGICLALVNIASDSQQLSLDKIFYIVVVVCLTTNMLADASSRPTHILMFSFLSLIINPAVRSCFSMT